MNPDALTRAIEILGSQSALAELCGTTQSQIWYWLNRSKKGVPAEFAASIERATDGRVTRHDLRPDIYPADPGPCSAAAQ